MKQVMMLLVVLGMAISAQAGNDLPLLAKEIGKKVILDISTIELNNGEEVIEVQFEIVESVIQIKSITGAKRALMEILRNKLETMKIESKYEANKMYSYRFVFEKE